MRSQTRSQDFNGDDLPVDLKQGFSIKQSQFIEVHGNGAGEYITGGLK